MRVLVLSLFVGVVLAAPQGYNYQIHLGPNDGGDFTFEQLQLLQQFASQQQQAAAQHQVITTAEPTTPVLSATVAQTSGIVGSPIQQDQQLVSYEQQQQVQQQQPQQDQAALLPTLRVSVGQTELPQQQTQDVTQLVQHSQTQLQAQPQTQTQPQPQPQPELQHQPQQQPQPQLHYQPQAQPQAKPQLQYQPQPQPKPQLQHQPQLQPQTQLHYQPQPQPQPQLQNQPHPQLQSQLQSQSHTQPQPDPEPQQQQSTQYSSASLALPPLQPTHHQPTAAPIKIPGPAQYNKEFYYLSAPQEDFELPHDFQNQLNKIKKNFRILFIKTPEQNGLEKAALQLANDAQNSQTAIYVLTKQHNAADLANKLQQLGVTSAQKPEVVFVKYRTPEEAEHAQRTIQSQYESLNGPNHFNYDGVVPTHNFIGSLAAIEPRQRPADKSAVTKAATVSPLDYLPPAE